MSIESKDEVWTGRVYRDNDPRSHGRKFTVLSEPEKDGRVSVLDDCKRKTKVNTARLYSNKYTRLPELEK